VRPRKVVLLINDREQERNCWHFVFENTLWFRVISEGAMPMAFHGEIPEVAVLRGRDARLNAEIIRLLFPEMRILAVATSGTLDSDQYINADAFLMPHATMAEIIDTLKTLALRKRGPKKSTVEPAAFPVNKSVYLGVTENVQ